MTTDFSYVGLEGKVITAIADGRTGEVSVQTPHGTVVLFARTAPGKSIAKGARVLVIDYHGTRRADVAEWNADDQYVPGIPQPSVPDAPPVEHPIAEGVYDILDLDRPVPDGEDAGPTPA